MLYGAITNIRNSLYDRGVFKSVALGVPVVSVGNITVGGTGKTPLVALIAGRLLNDGERVGILTRGYGRENPTRRVLVADGERVLAGAKQAGDEPLELARKLGGKAIIVADADRASAGIWAREKFGVTVFVLDDAFQHRKVRRDADIVLIDATNPFGSGKTLPFGILREPLENLKRADSIIITRANLAENIAALKSKIRRCNAVCPIYAAENRLAKLTALQDFNDQRTTRGERPTTKLFAFCALGNPNNFFDQLRQENLDVRGVKAFPDHHFYTPKDIAELQMLAEKSGAGAFVVTAKDAVKLAAADLPMPCLVAETAVFFDQEFEIWNAKI